MRACIPPGNGKPLRLGLMTWGWHRDFVRGGKPINARVEDILHKTTFAEAIQKRWCLVPATTWFEWQRIEGDRGIKHLLRPVGQETWALAGIWERPERRTAVVVLTTTAHGSVAAVHDRIPVVVVSNIVYGFTTMRNPRNANFITGR